MKTKTLLLLLILFPIFSFKSYAQKQGKITADLSNIKNSFDHVIIKMEGFSEFGDTITTIDTIQAKGGKFEYRFSVPETRMTTFELLKNNEIVTDIGIKDAITSKECGFFSEICVGNEDIKISYINSEKAPFVKAYCEGLKENKWYYWFDPTGIDYDRVTKEFVKKHPNRYAVLQAIYFQKELFSTTEISDMLNLFSDELKQSATYGVIKKYLNKMIALEKTEYAKSFKWQDINGVSYDFKTVLAGKKYVLLVFWSSTCETCRYQIKALKKFQEQYIDQVSVVNLSIDSDFQKWKEAVEEEKMTWYNLSGLPNNKEAIKEVYSISEVPEFILLDSESKSAIKNITYELFEIENFIKLSKRIAK